MDITTIKLHKTTKMHLDKIKESQETYDEAIQRLLAQSKRRELEEELIEGYHVMGKEDKELFEQWNGVDSQWPEY